MEAGTMAPPAPAGSNGSEPEPEQPESGEQELVVEGIDGQLSLSVGGKKPTVSGLRLVGGKVDVEGQFAKGEVVRLYVECQVGEVAFIDKTDAKTGQVTACERRHKARIIGVGRA